MKRLFVVLVLAFASVAASARADTFTIVPNAGLIQTGSVVQPNLPGSVGLPLDLTAPPLQPEQLSTPQLLSLWQRAGSEYGVPWQVLAAINKIESNFGRNMGPSSAGAIGWMQFMPDTWLRWGTDGNGDGVADPWNAEDAVTSAARYLAAAGGQSDLARAVFAYNHADWYVNEVLSLAQAYSGAGVQQLDGMQQRLDAAERQVSAANAAVVSAQRLHHVYTEREDRWLAVAATAPLLSDKLDAQKQATLAGVKADAAAALIAAARDRLAPAQVELEQARSAAQAASFDAGAGTLLGAPFYQGRYVFPVGGGPGVVSASHTHHDYPAVDIAAPEGSPVYALADATVLNEWREPDPSCGIGLTLRTFDGLVWTYCHLSYLEPSIADGTQLQGGDPVGLVGHTGDASGPHLHLQLQPPTEWPQQQPWFQSFAGVAFSWQDAQSGGGDMRSLAVVGSPPAALHPVFAVAPTAPSADSGDVVGFSLGG